MHVDDEVLINRLSRGLLPLDFGREWFRGLSEEVRVSTLKALLVMLVEAGATELDLDSAAVWGRVPATAQAWRTMKLGPLRTQGAALMRLQPRQREHGFELLLGLLAIADERRRRTCGTSCRHWWHQNLADESLVEKLRASRIRGEL